MSVRGLTELKRYPNGMLRLVKGLEIDIKEVCSGSDAELHFGDIVRGNIQKDYMEGFMKVEKGWDHNVEGDAVEGSVNCVC